MEESTNKHKSRKRQEGSRKLSVFIIALVIFLFVGGLTAYGVKASRYKSRFFPNTVINGINVEDKTAEEVKEAIRSQVMGYSIRILARDCDPQNITGDSVGLHYVFDSTLEDLIAQQNPLAWILHLNKEVDIQMDTVLDLDEDRFEAAVSALDAFKPENFVAPENARISEFKEGSGYSVVPEVLGNTLLIDPAKALIHRKILALFEEVNLDEVGRDLYEKPTIYSDDEALNQTVTQMNKYISSRITYAKVGTLDGNTIHQWLSVGEDGSVSVSNTGIANFVKSIAKAYNTINKPVVLKTSYGKTVTIAGGSYGWKVDEGKEAAALKQLILEGTTTDREPEYSSRAASRGENDYGDSYVEVNLTAQHMFLYKNGQKVLESDFVSGNESRGWTTPPGVFALTYKQRNATLKGENYATPVAYWMPFNRGIGFHDAPWRSKFGGNIYKTAGSHGCINLPPSVAKTLFEYLSTGYPVLCYRLEGTEPTPPPTQAAPEVTSVEPAPTAEGDAPTQASGE